MESKGYKIKIIGHSKKDDHTEYIINVKKSGQNFTITERYSGLRNLSESMRKFANKATFPKFPPKKFFGGDDEKFITKRQQELNTFFELISKDKEFSSLPPLVKFIQEKQEKEEKSMNNFEEEEIEEKELKKSFPKITENDYYKIVKDFNNKFYNMNDERETQNDNARFVNFFKNYKIASNDNEIKLDIGDENNFKCINEEGKTLESIENQIKQKMGKISELYQTLNDGYSIDGIVVPI